MANRLLVHIYIPFELWARFEARKHDGQTKWGIIKEVLDNEEKQVVSLAEISQERYDLQEK